jgi:hypothetical protein
MEKGRVHRVVEQRLSEVAGFAKTARKFKRSVQVGDRPNLLKMMQPRAGSRREPDDAT